MLKIRCSVSVCLGVELLVDLVNFLLFGGKVMGDVQIFNDYPEYKAVVVILLKK